MWGDMRRCGEMWGDMGRCGEMWGGRLQEATARLSAVSGARGGQVWRGEGCGEIEGDAARSHTVQLLAPAAVVEQVVRELVREDEGKLRLVSFELLKQPSVDEDVAGQHLGDEGVD